MCNVCSSVSFPRSICEYAETMYVDTDLNLCVWMRQKYAVQYCYRNLVGITIQLSINKQSSSMCKIFLMLRQNGLQKIFEASKFLVFAKITIGFNLMSSCVAAAMTLNSRAFYRLRLSSGVYSLSSVSFSSDHRGYFCWRLICWLIVLSVWSLTFFIAVSSIFGMISLFIFRLRTLLCSFCLCLEFLSRLLGNCIEFNYLPIFSIESVRVVVFSLLVICSIENFGVQIDWPRVFCRILQETVVLSSIVALVEKFLLVLLHFFICELFSGMVDRTNFCPVSVSSNFVLGIVFSPPCLHVAWWFLLFLLLLTFHNACM